MNSLTDRVIAIRNRFPCEAEWDKLSDNQRVLYILDQLNIDKTKYKDKCVVGQYIIFDIFQKAVRDIVSTNPGIMKLDNRQNRAHILNIFDLMEKYAKNWIFS